MGVRNAETLPASFLQDQVLSDLGRNALQMQGVYRQSPLVRFGALDTTPRVMRP